MSRMGSTWLGGLRKTRSASSRHWTAPATWWGGVLLTRAVSRRAVEPMPSRVRLGLLSIQGSGPPNQ